MSIDFCTAMLDASLSALYSSEVSFLACLRFLSLCLIFKVLASEESFLVDDTRDEFTVIDPFLFWRRGYIGLSIELKVMPKSVDEWCFIAGSSLNSLFGWLIIKEEFMPPGPHPEYFGIMLDLSLLPLEFLDKLLFLALMLSKVYILFRAFFVLLA